MSHNRNLVLFGFLLFICKIIPNGSFIIQENSDSGSESSLANQNATSSSQGANIPENYVQFADVHAAYKIYKENLTWDEARERCISEGARLAIADTQKKINHINSLKYNWGITWLHVGIRKSITSDQWVRIDNDLPATSLPWATNNPDDLGDCAGISISEDTLVNYGCDWGEEWFVCEIPIQKDS